MSSLPRRIVYEFVTGNVHPNKLSDFKKHLSILETLTFVQTNGDLVPAHFHITEVGLITKQFIDCGGTTCDPCPPKLTDFNFDFDTATPLEGSEGATFNDDATNTLTTGINSTLNIGEITGINSTWYSQLKYQYNDGIDLSTGDKGFSIKVKGPRALTVKIKVEDGGTEAAVDADYTTTNVWQELKFDFSAFNSNNNKKIAVFFAYEENGEDFTNPADNIFQIDDFVFGAFATLKVKDFEIEGLKAYPNPTNGQWKISTKDQEIKAIEVFNVLGKRVISLKPNAMLVHVDASGLAPGIYLTTITTQQGTSSRKLIKN